MEKSKLAEAESLLTDFLYACVTNVDVGLKRGAQWIISEDEKEAIEKVLTVIQDITGK